MNLKLKKAVFQINDKKDFESLCMKVFQHQFRENSLYRTFAKSLSKTPEHVQQISEIPFLPISFFKKHHIISGNDTILKTFKSSGTTGKQTSNHHVTDLSLYEESFVRGFRNQFPDYENSCIIALLPSYIEQGQSSLIYMIDHLINTTKNQHSGFYEVIDHQLLSFLEHNASPKILVGVSFALLELAKQQVKLKNTLVIETGGMKGRGKELLRAELHDRLKKGLHVSKVHSEYGMTELLSQAYMINEHFSCPPWMKVLIRDISDPLSVGEKKKGALNIIDLANLNSCSFIATDDLGELFDGEVFNVNGRIDHSLTRGCNLLI